MQMWRAAGSQIEQRRQAKHIEIKTADVSQGRENVGSPVGATATAAATATSSSSITTSNIVCSSLTIHGEVQTN